MKTKANSTRGMTAILALLSMMVIFSIGAAPAFADCLADRIGSVTDGRARLVETKDIRQLLPALDALVADESEDDDYVVEPEPEPETFPDGGGDEMVPEEPIPDGGGDEMVPEEPAVDDEADEAADDEADEPGDLIPGDDGGDEMVPEEPAVDDEADEADTPEGSDEADETEEPGDQAQEEEQQPEEAGHQSDEASTLAFTGGDTTPWFIAGVAITLAGAALLLRRRDGSDRR